VNIATHRFCVSVLRERISVEPGSARVELRSGGGAGAELVYVNVFGERVPHLHLNLAPHRAGDPLTNGAGMVSGEPPQQPVHTLRKAAKALAERLA
jgi:hypothetical protein